MTDPVNKLVEEIEQEMFGKLMMNPYWANIQLNMELCKGISQYISKDALRIVLSAIQRGEACYATSCPDGCCSEIELYDDFKKFMEVA